MESLFLRIISDIFLLDTIYFKRYSIIIILGCQFRCDLSLQLIYLVINIANILTVALILSLFELLLVSFLVLGAELIFNLRLLLTLLFYEQFLDGGHCARNGFFVLQDVVKLRI